MEPMATGTRVSWVGIFENREFAEKMRQFLETANEQNLSRLALEVAAGAPRDAQAAKGPIGSAPETSGRRGAGKGAMALSVILVLYVTIGLVSSTGSIAISKKLFSAKAEQIFFGFLLVPIAGFYLAFTAYFGDAGAWRHEAAAMALFAVLGILGCRVPVVLMLGYALHGLWDLLHELHAHAGIAPGMGTWSEIPLAYGAFCGTLDWCLAGYFYTRRRAWSAAWSAGTVR